MGWYVMVWDGMVWDGMEWDGINRCHYNSQMENL